MIAAVLMVRDEQDVIADTITHLLGEGVDHIVVADNLSVDNTRLILESFNGDRVHVLEDDEPGYYQDRKMTELARWAHRELGADWILPCDADEVWYWPNATLDAFFAHCDVDIVVGSGWDHIATDDDDPSEGSPFRRIEFRRQAPQKLNKVAFRYHPDAWIDFGNHDVFNHPGRRGSGLRYRHFQYRSFEQMSQKLRQGKEAFDATDLHPMYGTHWREGGALSDDELWRKWRRLCEEPGLVHDPAPVR